MNHPNGKGGRTAALPDQLARLLERLRAGDPASPIAIAFSGGLDSSALLHMAARYAGGQGVPLYAFHVHHGLSPNADAWLAHCEAQAAQLGARFDARRVTLARDGSGTEASARKARYAALGEMCRAHGVRLLLTAHHQDDQAETVLLQLLRGSGPAGLSGMEEANAAPGLLGDADTTIARPLLGATRVELETYVAAHDIAHIDDESNADPRFTRNALRHQVMPAVAAAFPGYQQRLARAAAHAHSAQRLLAQLGEQDLDACEVDGAIDCTRLRTLDHDRAANMLRHWFHRNGIAMPSTAWLAELIDQAVGEREDAQVTVTHPDCHVRRHRDRLLITPRLAPLEDEAEEPAERTLYPFRWNGETSIAFPALGGTLHIDQAEQGIDPAWLRTRELAISLRRGGERLRPAHNRPSRSLKQHYQTLGVPAWERTRLPVVTSGGELLFAAGIGMDCQHAGAPSGLVFRWCADPA